VEDLSVEAVGRDGMYLFCSFQQFVAVEIIQTNVLAQEDYKI
jgi:hypothetical protein